MNPQFQNTVPSTPFDPGALCLADRLRAFWIAGDRVRICTSDEMNAR
jgi:hypothetical protein